MLSERNPPCCRSDQHPRSPINVLANSIEVASVVRLGGRSEAIPSLPTVDAT